MPPQVTKQTSTANGLKSPIKPVSKITDILDSGVPVASLEDLYVKLALYGRNRVGKTTLACQFKKPLALLSIEPSPTGGARSVMKMPGITVYRVGSRPMKGNDGKPEPYFGSEKILTIAEALKSRFDRNQRPFETIVIDGVTSWNDIILQEVLGVNPDDMPAILGFGKVSQDQYTERAERIIRYVRPFLDLPCNVVIIAQEKDHNPPKDEKGRPENKLIRGMQDASFFSLDISATPAKWIQDACDFVGQLYEDAEYEEITNQIKIGTTVRDEKTLVPTGRRVRRLRTLYHPNYASGFRSPDYRSVPEYIQAGTPEEFHQELLKVVRGEKTSKGKYS